MGDLHIDGTAVIVGPNDRLVISVGDLDFHSFSALTARITVLGLGDRVMILNGAELAVIKDGTDG